MEALNNVEYSWVRGFNYQPSYASHGIELWGAKFDAHTIDIELRRGLQHFPKMNTVRLWFSHDAYILDRVRFIKNMHQAVDIVRAQGLKYIPILFNGWHSLPDVGGMSVEQLGHFDIAFYAEYVQDVVGALKDDPNVLMWDLCNEPFNNARQPEPMEQVRQWLVEIHACCKDIDGKTPICVGSAPNMNSLRTLEPIMDVITFHPYFAWNSWVPSQQEYTSFLDDAVRFINDVGKPALVTETCWGSLDDMQRTETGRFELSQQSQRNLGFVVHLLHYTLVADGHRPHDGPITPAGYMAFIEKDGSLRPGHGFFNDY